MLQEASGDRYLIRVVPYGFAHNDSRPVIFLLPLNLATQCRGFLNDRVVMVRRVES